MNNASKLMLLAFDFVTDHGGTAGALRAIKEYGELPTKEARRGRRLLIKYVLVLHKLEQKRMGAKI